MTFYFWETTGLILLACEPELWHTSLKAYSETVSVSMRFLVRRPAYCTLDRRLSRTLPPETGVVTHQKM